MSDRLDHIPNRRAIIDRRVLAAELEALAGSGTALRQAGAALLRPALDTGRAEIARRLAEHPSQGAQASAAHRSGL